MTGGMNLNGMGCSPFFDLDADGMRSSVRFPVHLSVTILADDRQIVGVTENISSNGVLFRLDEQLPADTLVEFLLEIPAGKLNGEDCAAVHCLGRVIRSYTEHSRCYAAAVIDEYRFQ
jgi:hypothetical protein